jgi:hypothetical protein
LFYENCRIFEIHQLSQASVEQIAQLREERLKNEPNFQLFSDV